MTDRDNRTDPEPLAQAAEEVAIAHHGLSYFFASIEAALNAGDMALAARLLGDLIAQAREHFIQEESIALGAGRNDATDRLNHDTFLERARHLKLICKRAAVNDNTDNAVDARPTLADVQRGLVLLMSDMVESDVRLQSRLGARPRSDRTP